MVVRKIQQRVIRQLLEDELVAFCTAQFRHPRPTGARREYPLHVPFMQGDPVGLIFWVIPFATLSPESRHIAFRYLVATDLINRLG